MAPSTVQAGRPEGSRADMNANRRGGFFASVAELVRSKVLKKQEVAPARARPKPSAKKVTHAPAPKKTTGKQAALAKKPPILEKVAPVATKKGAAKAGREKVHAVPAARPRATKLPPVGNALNKRELEQLLTAGAGRGVNGEGSLKGKLAVKDGFPYLHVAGRDKRELQFLLQGPDQEVLPAYSDHKVSVSGLIRKTSNHGGTVDVRKWTAKKPEDEQAAPEPQEQKLRFLSPGEVEQLCTGGMGAGLVGFARFRGTLEMTGDDFFLAVSGVGTRQQVSFLIEGKHTKGLR